MKQPPVALRNDWFTKLTGFSERSPNQVRENITIQDGCLSSKINLQSFQCGCLEIVSLRELRERVAKVENVEGKLQVAELVGDAQALHAEPANAGAVFQVASQFNLLEMVSPSVTPEQGIGIYENDPTQGPVCSQSARSVHPTVQNSFDRSSPLHTRLRKRGLESDRFRRSRFPAPE